jgi:hypothetical protein
MVSPLEAWAGSGVLVEGLEELYRLHYSKTLKQQECRVICGCILSLANPVNEQYPDSACEQQPVIEPEDPEEKSFTKHMTEDTTLEIIMLHVRFPW